MKGGGPVRAQLHLDHFPRAPDAPSSVYLGSSSDRGIRKQLLEWGHAYAADQAAQTGLEPRIKAKIDQALGRGTYVMVPLGVVCYVARVVINEARVVIKVHRLGWSPASRPGLTRRSAGVRVWAAMRAVWCWPGTRER